MARKLSPRLRSLLLSLLVFMILVAFLWQTTARLQSTSRREETELIRTAVRSAALTCFAVEGAYPSELSYLKEHYGLLYDEENYLIDYDAFASNLMPDITVLERGAGWNAYLQ